MTLVTRQWPMLVMFYVHNCKHIYCTCLQHTHRATPRHPCGSTAAPISAASITPSHWQISVYFIASARPLRIALYPYLLVESISAGFSCQERLYVGNLMSRLHWVLMRTLQCCSDDYHASTIIVPYNRGFRRCGVSIERSQSVGLPRALCLQHKQDNEATHPIWTQWRV